ncbi:MAG: SDR family oxidoreductase [Peptococcaceae bacterium]|jgi:3-oxoacyl-[acyl-carrier protein] reductase|nr:SDR family oxidoreductase [Peptococcaceae bacterium]
MARLDNKVALITGAGSGMGRAASLLFAQEGAKVVVADFNEENGKKVVEEIKAQGGQAAFVFADVSKAEYCKGAVDFTIETYGKIDVVFCCAGIAQKAGMIWELDESEFDKVMAVNTKSSWLMAKYSALELKKNHGSLILIGSTAAIRPRATQGLYGACKAANNNLAIGLAAELAPEARCNCINPGPTATPMLPTFVQAYNDQVADEIAGGTLLKRLVDPMDIANAALFFASDESRSITGVSILVDAGADKARGKN